MCSYPTCSLAGLTFSIRLSPHLYECFFRFRRYKFIRMHISYGELKIFYFLRRLTNNAFIVIIRQSQQKSFQKDKTDSTQTHQRKTKKQKYYTHRDNEQSQIIRCIKQSGWVFFGWGMVWERKRPAIFFSWTATTVWRVFNPMCCVAGVWGEDNIKKLC